MNTSSTTTAVDDKPDSIPDFLLLGGMGAIIIPFLLSNVAVFKYRKRKYFQASGWELILGSSVAGIIWIASAFIVNQHFKRDRWIFLSYCALWTYWFQLALGLCLWLSFMALRLYHLHVYCTTGKAPDRRYLWGVYLPGMMAPAIVFAIIATYFKFSRHPCGIIGRCVIEHLGWKLASFLVLPPIYFSMIVFLVFRLRKNKDYLLKTQLQHTTDYGMMAFVLYLLTGTTYWNNNNDNKLGRCFLTFSVCSVVFAHFWMHTGLPVYLCVFKGVQEMDNFEENLRRRGAHCLSAPRGGASGNEIPSFTSEGEEAIFQAIAAEHAKRDELKVKRDQLQRRVTQLTAKLEEVQHQSTVAVEPHSSQRFPSLRRGERVQPEGRTRHHSWDMSSHLSPTRSPILMHSSIL